MKHEQGLQPPPGLQQFRHLVAVDDETAGRLEAFVALLDRWRKRINLVSSASMTDVWRRHILDSAQLASLLPSSPGDIVDLGSGGGFPGLVVALVTGQHVHLVESDSRKCAFLREAARQTAAPVDIHNQRAETLHERSADVIMARACAPLDQLLSHTDRLLRSGGIGLFLKGRTIASELTAAQKQWIFRSTLIPSRSDPSGMILKVEELQHRNDSRSH